MFKHVSIFLLAVSCLISITNGRQLSNDTENDLDPNNGEQTAEIVDDDLFHNESLDSLNLARLIKRAIGGRFIDEQVQFQRELLQSHNNYRKHHCVSALQLDNGLSRSAQAYAEKLARTNTFKHSKTANVGENLWSISSSRRLGTIKGSQASDRWYNEIKYYNFNNGGFSKKTGHFTQLVWKNTRRVGAGIAYNRDHTKAYVVAHYAPPGNFPAQYRQNVLRRRC